MATPPLTCAMAQASVNITGTAAVSDTLTVQTQTSAALHIPARPSDRTWYAAGGAALACILLIGLPGRRRAWQRMLSLMFLVIAVGVVGCGGGSSGGGGGSSTPGGSYTVTVTAVSGTIQQTSTVMVTVQ
jgi:trimeric autotransporter adhesin